MYITEIVKFVKEHYPSEYTSEDMFRWCDELSAQLIAEDRQIYKEAELTVYKDGSTLLPEGVRLENVVKVYAGGRKLTKHDLRTVYGHRGIRFPPVEPMPRSVTVVYQSSYEPIRLVKYTGKVMLDKEKSTVKMYKDGLITGDTIIIKIGGVTLDSVHVMGVEIAPDDFQAMLITVNNGALDAAEELISDNAAIQRYITDKTVCAAPYDTMYEDYILAKICYFQHDTSGYNQHISAFNSRLADYKRWLADKLPYDDGQFVNYWKGV